MQERLGSTGGCADGRRGLRATVARCLATKASWRSLQGMSSSDWPINRLLLALPTRNFKQLMPELEQVRCQRGQVLMDADSSLHHVFFPDSGVVSVWRFMRMAVSLRWQQSVGRVAQVYKPSSVPRLLPSGFSSKSRGAQQRCRARRSHGPWSRCRPSVVSCTLTYRPFSNRSWCL